MAPKRCRPRPQPWAEAWNPGICGLRPASCWALAHPSHLADAGARMARRRSRNGHGPGAGTHGVTNIIGKEYQPPLYGQGAPLPTQATLPEADDLLAMATGTHREWICGGQLGAPSPGLLRPSLSHRNLGSHDSLFSQSSICIGPKVSCIAPKDIGERSARSLEESTWVKHGHRPISRR